jgi:hypothetical protein
VHFAGEVPSGDAGVRAASHRGQPRAQLHRGGAHRRRPRRGRRRRPTRCLWRKDAAADGAGDALPRRPLHRQRELQRQGSVAAPSLTLSGYTL